MAANSALYRLSSLSPRTSRQVVCRSRTGLLFCGSLPHARSLSLRKDLGTSPPSARNYWWSSSPSKTPSVVNDQQSQEVAELPPVPEQFPPETAAFVEPQSAVDAVDLDVTTVPSDVSMLDPSSIPPLNYGDLAALGLAGWSPAGICRWGIELLQVSTGLPWFWTIIGATVATRLVLFPFTVRSMQNTAALAPYQDEINGLRKEMTQAQASGDRLALQTVALKQQRIYRKAGVSIGGMAMLPFMQLPVTLGAFFGVKSLCDLPLEQLKWSGVSFLPDLTIADPTYVLPVISAVLMNAQLSMGVSDMTAAPHMAHVVNGFRLLSAVGVLFMMNLPSGVMVYLVTSIGVGCIQTLALRQPVVRRALGIPVVQRSNQLQSATFKESYEYARNWWQEKKEERAEIIRRSRK